MTIRQQALDDASGLIHGPRQDDYGPPSVNFQRIADRWTQTLGTEVRAHQVALLMADLKLARLAEGYTADSVLDAIGYLALAAELEDCEEYE